MDELEYRIRLSVIKTSIGGLENFNNFEKAGINQAKEIILLALEQNPEGLTYVQIELKVLDKLDTPDSWKPDCFHLGLFGLVFEDKKIVELKPAIFTLAPK